MYALEGNRVTYNGWKNLRKFEALTFVHRTLTRRERNNGVLRHLVRELDHQGKFRYERNWEVRGCGVSRLAIAVAFQASDNFRVECDGFNADLAVARANQLGAPEPAKKKKRVRGAPATQPITAVQPPLRKQYPHHPMTWNEGIAIIAHAHKLLNWVAEDLLLRNHSCGHRYRLVRDGIVMQLEVEVDSGLVGLWCTKNNKHRAYRRLRNKLKQMFHIVSKDKEERRKKLRFIRLQKRLAAAA